MLYLIYSYICHQRLPIYNWVSISKKK